MTAGDITVGALAVRYPGADRPVVDGLDLTIDDASWSGHRVATSAKK